MWEVGAWVCPMLVLGCAHDRLRSPTLETGGPEGGPGAERSLTTASPAAGWCRPQASFPNIITIELWGNEMNPFLSVHFSGF